MATLKQSTAYTRAFYIVQSSDHLSGLTGATPTVNISKAGAAFGAAGGTVTEIANGWYKIALTTTDTNTLGDLAFHITATSGDATDFVDQVTANILGDTLPANVTQISGSAVSTSSAQIGVNVVNYAGVAATVDANNLPKVDVEDWKAAVAPAMTGDAYARLGAPAGASVSADIAAAPGKVWDVTLSGHLTSGTTGNALNAAGAAGDPWSTAIPGSYGAGTAGNIVGNNLNAAISSRLASSAVPTNFSSLAITGGGAVTVGTNGDKTGYALTSGERISVADAILDRDMSVGTDSGSPTVRTVRQALRFLRNKWAVATGTLTVYKEDDATASWTAAVTTDGTAQPIVTNDPA